MASFHDRRAAQDEAAARARIEAIYRNAGDRAGVNLPLPANIDAQVRRVMSSGGDYLDTIRSHAARNAANPGELQRFNQNYQAPISNRNPQPKPPPPGDTNFTSPGNLSPGTTPTADPGPTGPQPSRAEAQARFPWLTGRVLTDYVDYWVETGSPTAAISRLRNDSGAYKQMFPGIMRNDGTLRMDENTYWGEREGVAEAAAEFGFNPDKYRKQFGSLIEQGIDASEFFAAAQEAVGRFNEPGGERTELTEQFLDQFTQTGSREAALENVRSSSAYDNVFAGNRREDGTLRMDEPDYFAYKRGWQRLFLSRGINPQPFEAQGLMVEAIEGENSIDELDAKITGVEKGIIEKDPAILATFNSYYGQEGAAFLAENGSPQTALAMAVSPKVGKELLNRRITAAQIGGEAQVRGFLRDVDRAEELARAGLDQTAARQVYSQAERQLPGLSATTRRFNRGDTTIGDFEDVFGLGDASGRLRIERSLQAEGSSFSGRSDVRRDRDGLGLSGLRQR